MAKLISMTRASAITKMAKEFEEKRGGLPGLKAGVHLCYLKKVEGAKTGIQSKTPGRQMVVLTWQDAKEECKEVVERFAVEGEEQWVDIHLQKMVTRAGDLGMSSLPEIEDEKALVKWWSTGLNKKLKLAIAAKARLWENMKDNLPDYHIIYDPEVAYSGAKDSDLERSFDIAKNTVDLPNDKQVLYDNAMGHGDSSANSVALPDELDELDEVAQETLEPVASKPKPAAAKVTVAAVAAEEIDDLDELLGSAPKKAVKAEAVADDVDFDNLDDFDI